MKVNKIMTPKSKHRVNNLVSCSFFARCGCGNFTKIILAADDHLCNVASGYLINKDRTVNDFANIPTRQTSIHST